MTPSLLVATLISLTAPPPPPACAHASMAGDGAAVSVDPDAYRELWESGQGWTSFLAGADSRGDLWTRNWASSAEIDPDLVERARAAGGTWYILAVAIHGCSDSVSTLPFLARLADRVDGLELRVVDSDRGAWVMEENPTPDGRPATPTIVLLSPRFEKRGCFIERPSGLQDRLLENPDGLSRRGLYDYKMEWYETDAGDAAVREFVEVIEAAASGTVRCG